MSRAFEAKQAREAWEAFKSSLPAAICKELDGEIGSLEIALELALEKHIEQ